MASASTTPGTVASARRSWLKVDGGAGMSHHLLALIRRRAGPGFGDTCVNGLGWVLFYDSGRRPDTGRRVSAIARGLRDP